MGQLLHGTWVEQRVDAGSDEQGRFIRQDAQFRSWILADGSSPFQPEVGRYHLYLSAACPWCHRLDVALRLKHLQGVVDVSFVHPLVRDGGWRFRGTAFQDALFGYGYAHQLYTRANPGYTGRVTVPLLWDTHTDQPVSNESSEILRMFDQAFGDLAGGPELYPEAHREAIDAWNDRIYHSVNNGVYRCGFAQTQHAYEEAFQSLFETLDAIEAHLADREWLVGGQLTEADLRLFVTLVRFDAVYVGHFRCNRNRIVDMPGLQGLLERIYALPGVAETVRMEEIKQHYYQSHRTLNPSGLIPVGPQLDWLR